MNKTNLTLALLVLLLLGNLSSAMAQESSARSANVEKGKAAAAADIKNEKFVFRAWGLAPTKLYSWESAEEIYHRILKEKYKITFEWVGGCMVDEAEADYSEGYNEVLKLGIEAKYGTGVLEKARQQANEEYEEKYGEKERELNRKFLELLRSIPNKSDNER